MPKTTPAASPLTPETVDAETLYEVKLARTVEVGPLTLGARRSHQMRGRVIKQIANDVREILPLAS